MKTAPLSRKQRMLMHCAPFTEDRIHDRQMRSAIHRARKSEELAHQQAFDRAIAALVHATHIPVEVEAWFTKETMVAPPRRTWKNIVLNPAVIAVGIAFAVIAGFLGLHFAQKWNDFPGAETARKLLIVAASSRSVLLDPVKTEAGALGDLFFMKHRLPHYDVPAEFAELKTIGCRVFDDEDSRRVAQIWVTEKKMQFFLFPAERDMKSGAVRTFDGWRYVTQEGWSGVVREKNGVCFMASLRGPERDLASYVKAKE